MSELPASPTTAAEPARPDGGRGSAALYDALALRTIPGLDGVRAIAVLSVVVYHAGWERVNGSQGVLVFFTLSGFLITWLLLGERALSLKRFYTRRALRLFPAFYAYWLAAVAIGLFVTHTLDWTGALSAFFYVGNYFNATHGHPASALSHTWSLAVEEQFYVLWPPVLLALGRETTRLVGFLIGIIGAVWLYRTGLFLAGVSDAWLYNAFDCRADQLLVGCLGAVLLRRRALPRWFGFVARSRALAGCSFMLLLAIGWFEAELGRAFLFIVAHALEPIVVMALLVFVIANANSAVGRVLGSTALSHIGKVSYGIYLYHPLLHRLIRARLTFLPETLQMLGVVIACVTVATVSHELYERPFLKLKERFR